MHLKKSKEDKMKSKYFLGMWLLISVFFSAMILPPMALKLRGAISIVTFVILFVNWCAFCHHSTKYYFSGVSVKRLENKAQYRVLEQNRVMVTKDGQNKYDFHLKLVNLGDNMTRFYLLENYIPIFDEKGKRLEEFPDAFKLTKTREWVFIKSEPYFRTFYCVIPIPCP